jgi:pimeloyl-ACP methyl ester carboxylesterase
VPARLHHDRIAGPAATRWLLLTHGIFGSGGNWRGIAKQLVERRPDWGVVLVDLRGHGRSELGPPPQDLAACADDLRALIDDVPVDALAGHSFGGKVVLAARALAPRRVRQIWMFDATPSARPEPAGTVMRVLALMERLPRRWARRDDFVTAVVSDGHAPALAQWLAMNVVPDDDGYVLRLDLVAIRALLADYFARDLWSVALDPELPGELEVVVAERSDAISADDRVRLAASRVHLHRIDADHWLHIEAPAAVIALFAAALPK